MLDVVIGRLLNGGWLLEAKELADLFAHESADLTIALVSTPTINEIQTSIL